MKWDEENAPPSEENDLKPGNVDPAPYLEKLIYGATYEDLDRKKAPKGKVISINFPEEQRYDFFLGEGKENIIREVWFDYEGDQTIRYFKANFDDDSIKASKVMLDWYTAVKNGSR